MTVAAPARHRRVKPSVPPPPAATGVANRAWDVYVVLAVNAIIIPVLWLRHGGAGTLHHPGGMYVAVGQLTGLYGTFAVLVELLLMSRIGWLERYVGFDRLA